MLIVDMEMPKKRCFECACIDSENGRCQADKEQRYVDFNIPNWCPIKGELVRCGECRHYHSEDDPAYCDELCTIHIDKTDGCLRGIKRGGKVGYRAADGERKDGETDGES